MSEDGIGPDTSAPLPPPPSPPLPPPAGPLPPPSGPPSLPPPSESVPPSGATAWPPPTPFPPLGAAPSQPAPAPPPSADRPSPGTAQRGRPWWKSPWLIVLAAVAVLAAVVGVVLAATNGNNTTSSEQSVASSPATTAAATTNEPTTTIASTTAPTTTAATTTTTTTTVATTTTIATTAAPTAPTVPPGPLPSFGAGTKVVGTDIQPGRYLSLGGPGCYFARLRDLSGTVGGIIANDNPIGEAIVDIAPTDAAFQSSDCSDWVAFLGGDPQTTFGDGQWEVNTHIAPGRWSAPGGAGCYWARTKDFSHTIDGIIANDNPTGQAVVDILPTDVGFMTSRCGTWTKIG
jgi:hypothetical protein